MIPTLVFGLLFGFILSRVGATQYDTIANMFLLRDFHLMGVIALAILVAGVGMALFRRYQVKAPDGAPLKIAPKPRKPGNLLGGLLFGAGWALAGACPGTALAQLGEGSLVGLFTVLGIFLGTMLYRRVGARVERSLLKREPGPLPGGHAAEHVKDAPVPALQK